MSTITAPAPVALPDGYRVLDFEVDGFATQDRANAAVRVLFAAEILDAELTSKVAAGYLASLAAEQVARFPQYDGMFNSGWRLCWFPNHLVTKGGCRFAAGDMAIVRLEASPFPFSTPSSWTAWSLRGSVRVEVPAGSFELV